MAVSCDFRVQCGRCSTDQERSDCQILWSIWTILYGLVGIGMLWQNHSSSMEKKPQLLKRVLNLWAIACLFRVAGGIVLASHSDVNVPPIIMEMLWHIVWLSGCFALTYFVVVISNAVLSIIGRTVDMRIPVAHIVTVVNIMWACIFFYLSIRDGMDDGWPMATNNIQWFVWMVCATYLFSGVLCGVRKLGNLIIEYEAEDKIQIGVHLRSFSYAIIAGLGLYSALLLALAVITTFYRDSITLTAEIIITCFHQIGMLCMGIGMQLGISTLTIFGRSFGFSKSPHNSADPESANKPPGSKSKTASKGAKKVDKQLSTDCSGPSSTLNLRCSSPPQAQRPSSIARAKESSFDMKRSMASNIKSAASFGTPRLIGNKSEHQEHSIE